MIAGLETPTAGRIWVGDEELTDKSVQERQVGFVFQHYALFRHMTVRGQRGVRPGACARSRRRRSEQRVDELLELVQLAPFANRYPDQLSGGQRQRVALARALAPQPQVLLLDEPFGALDARVRQDLRRWLDELHRELGVTSLLVTHDQEEALELANQIVVMHEGRVEQVGSPGEIYDEPATAFVAGFVGSANVLHGEVVDGHVHLGSCGCPAPDTSRRARPPPPSCVPTTSDRDGDGGSYAKIERVASLGWLARLSLRLPGGETLVAHVPQDELAAPGRATRSGWTCATRRRSSLPSTRRSPTRSSLGHELGGSRHGPALRGSGSCRSRARRSRSTT